MDGTLHRVGVAPSERNALSALQTSSSLRNQTPDMLPDCYTQHRFPRYDAKGVIGDSAVLCGDHSHC